MDDIYHFNIKCWPNCFSVVRWFTSLQENGKDSMILNKSGEDYAGTNAQARDEQSLFYE